MGEPVGTEKMAFSPSLLVFFSETFLFDEISEKAIGDDN